MSNKLFTFGKPATGTGFTDRKKETERLVSNFKYGINTFIVSPRRWGKTSLVMKAMEQAKSDTLKIVFVDVFNCKDENQFCEKLSSAVLSQTSRKMDEVLENAKAFLNRITIEVGLSPDPINSFDIKMGVASKDSNIEEILSIPQKIATKQGVDIVVCIDEFQQIGEFKDSLTFQKTLRTVWQHQENVTYCLFGSKKHIMEKLFDSSSKPFYKFGDIMYLDRIPLPYWKKFIKEKYSQAGKKISDDLCKKLCETVRFDSSYIQQLSWYLFQETDAEADEAGLSDAVEELIMQNSQLFQSRTEGLTAYQMNYLRAIADGNTSGLASSAIISRYKLGSSANVAAIGKQMVAKDLTQENNGEISLTDPVLGMWLQRN